MKKLHWLLIRLRLISFFIGYEVGRQTTLNLLSKVKNIFIDSFDVNQVKEFSGLYSYRIVFGLLFGMVFWTFFFHDSIYF